MSRAAVVKTQHASQLPIERMRERDAWDDFVDTIPRGEYFAILGQAPAKLKAPIVEETKPRIRISCTPPVEPEKAAA